MRVLSTVRLEAGDIGIRGIAQSGSASALGAEGRGFESLCPDHYSVIGVILELLNAPVAQLDRAPAF